MRRNKTFFSLNLNSLLPCLPFLLLLSTFVISVLIGSLLVAKVSYFSSYAETFISDFVLERKEFNFYTVFKSSLISILPLYMLLFLFGTSVIGCVAVPLIPVVKGLLYGSVSGYLYTSYSLEGIMFNALLIIPSLLVTVFGMVLLGKDAFDFSGVLSKICIKSGKPVNVYNDFKLYCTRSLIALLVAVIAIIFDVGMSALFIKYFNF